MRRSLVRDPGFWLVLVVGCLWAGYLYAQFLPQSRHLWHSFLHDRNAHYFNAQSIALDLRQGDLIHLVKDVDRLRVWGPLHPIVTGAFLAIVGVDYRLAVIPSLLCWVGTAALAYALVRRMVPGADRSGALLAAFLVLASPAYRAFSLDIMLESPGAFLTALLAYTYVRARQQPSLANDRYLALSLSALFFVKSNYWILGWVGLTLAEAFRHRAWILRVLVRTPGRLHRLGLAFWLRQPLFWAVSLPLLAIVALKITGPWSVAIGSKTWTLAGLEIPATLLAWSTFLTFMPWWWRVGRHWFQARLPRIGTLIGWHLIPLLVWFVLPQRAGLFVSYLTRDHGVGESADGLVSRLNAYWATLGQDYHEGAMALLAVVLLGCVAVLGCRSLRPGASMIIATVLGAIVLTAMQPCCRSRFLHTWQVLLWTLAGTGAAIASGILARSGWSPLKWAPGLLVLGLTLAHAPQDHLLGQAPESGLRPQLPSALELADAYLPELPSQGKVAILSNLPMKFYSLWTCQQAQGATGHVEAQAFQIPLDPGAWEEWLARRGWTSLVWIDVIDSRGIDHLPDPTETRDQAAKLPELLRKQTILHPRESRLVPELGCKVTVWSREL